MKVSGKWLDTPATQAVCAMLTDAGFQALFVGGCVRNALLNEPVGDIDIATDARPEIVIELSEKTGFKPVPTGLEHGTVTVVANHIPHEITTFRKDVESHGRHATVAFSENVVEDARRRDFTMNALYASADGAVVDPLCGMRDLDARRVRFIDDADQRIREDYLRILRYFRFQARFGSELDPQAEDACVELAEGLRGLSRERVAMELTALLSLPEPARTVARMREIGVLGEVLPESTPREIEALGTLIDHEQASGVGPDPIRRLAALLPPIENIAQSVAVRLRLSRKKRERLCCAAARSEQDAHDPRALAYRHGMECTTDRLLIAGTSIDAIKGWEIPRFPLKGGEIVARGVSAGPEVAGILQRIEDRWIAAGFPDSDAVERFLNDEMLQR